VKHAIAVSIALPLLLPLGLHTRAAGIEDLVRANCTKQIVSSTDVSRNAIKTFRIEPHGDGYHMIGRNEEQQTVTCEAAADGHVTWVRVS
jgi:hypothetical protein